MIVLDTSTVLYWTLDPERLSSLAKRTIDESEEVLVSAISIWEIGVKVQKGKLGLPLSIREFAYRLDQVSGVTIVPVDVQIWLLNLELPWAHRDPADRTIVATAQYFDCPLITSDERILAFYSRAVW